MARLVLALAAIATTGLRAQQEPVPPTPPPQFTCVMHPDLRVARAGRCPHCSMELVRAAPAQGRIAIGPGGLRSFCEQAIGDAVRRRDPRVSAFDAVDGFVALKGPAAVEHLRGMLHADKIDWVAAAALHLGRLQDRASIPALERLLGDDRLDDNDFARICIAGALHQMGNETGMRVLESLETATAISTMALRDTPEVRRAVASAAASENEKVRLHALAAALRLGLGDVEKATGLLRSDDARVRHTILFALGDAPQDDARAALHDVAGDRERPVIDRLLAAQALVKRGDDERLDFLMDRFFKATDAAERACVIHALGEVGDARVLDPLQSVIEGDPQHREWAVTAAAKVLGRVTRPEKGK